MFAIGIVNIPIYARITRASVLSIKQQDYVLAGRSIGSTGNRILFQNILPNALTPLVVQGTLGIGTTIIEAAALSFLGLGAQPPTPQWGSIIGQERNQVFTAPQLIFFPGIALVLTVVGFNLLGDGLHGARAGSTAAVVGGASCEGRRCAAIGNRSRQWRKQADDGRQRRAPQYTSSPIGVNWRDAC